MGWPESVSVADVGEKTDDGDVNEVPQLDKTGEEYHGDEHHNGGIHQSLELLKPLNIWIRFPRPACFAQFAFHFAEEACDFGDHSDMMFGT